MLGRQKGYFFLSIYVHMLFKVVSALVLSLLIAPCLGFLDLDALLMKCMPGITLDCVQQSPYSHTLHLDL